MLRLRTVICILLFTCLQPIAAQTGAHHYELLTTRSGLNHNHVLSIAQDEKGYLWIGTRNGLCRFDGQDFAIYTDLFDSADNSLKNGVETIYCYRNERWIGTRGGLVACLDANTGKWKKIVLPDGTYGIKSIVRTERNGTFVGLYSGQVLVLDSNKNYQRSFKVSDFEVRNFSEQGNDVIIYTDLLYRYRKNGTLAPVQTSIYVPVWPSASLHKNKLFIAQGEGKFGIYDLLSQKAVTISERKYNNDKTQVVHASENGFVIADNNTISSYNKEGYPTHVFRLDENENTHRWELINVVFTDKEGNLWIGTEQGLARIVTRRSRFKHFTTTNRLRKLSHNYIRALYADRQAIWVGSKLGNINKIEYASAQNTYRIKSYDFAASPEKFTINAIMRLLNGKLIAGGDGGLFVFNGTTFGRYPLFIKKGLDSRYNVWMIRQDKAGRTWISAYAKPHNQLFIINSNFSDLIAVDHDAMIWNMLEDRTGTIWLCSESGLEKAITDPVTGKISFIHHTQFARNRPAGLKMWHIVESDPGNLWIGTTDNGLLHFNTGTGYFTSYTEKHGLPANTISGLLLPAKKQLWIGTVNGLAVMDLAHKTFNTYTEEDGIINNDLNFKTCLVAPWGELFWGTKTGLMSFYPDSIKPYFVTSPVEITNINIMGKEAHCGDTVVIRPGENMFAIKFALLEHTYHKHYYRYRLHGFNQQWLHASERNPVATYTNLPPGEYSLEIQAAVSPDKWLPQHKRLTIVVKPALWQNTWFILLCTFMVLCIAALFIYIRFRKVVRTERERHGIRQKITELELSALQAQMNPHFIFNAIHSIQHFIVKNDEVNANEYLTKFANLMRLFLESSKKKLIPLAEEIEILTLYTQLEKLRFEERFDVQIDVAADIDSYATEIPSMLLQPFVENAIIHGLVYKKEKGLLSISIMTTATGICCTVDDNGIGREASRALRGSEHNPRGMELILDRVNSYNELHNTPLCSIQLTDKKDNNDQPAGTRIEIVINTN